jgi:tetrapyrrole methylase family protein / MazG family protein
LSHSTVSRPTVTIVGLGPAGPDLVTSGTLAAIEAASELPRFLRTERHPAASVLRGAVSCDDLYERGESFDEVYAAIVERVVHAARQHGGALYAVPGSPAVAERTVELLRADERIGVHVLPALSFIDLAWVRLGIDPLRERPRIVDAHSFARDVAGDRGPFLVTQCHSSDVMSDIKLAFDDHPPERVTVIARLGLSDETVSEIAWNELDRVPADHLTSLWIPRLGTPLAAAVVTLEAVMRELRGKCPWYLEQTHTSLARYATEEADELVEAIAGLAAAETEESIDHLADELGDVAFQVFFHACLAAEQGWFTPADVFDGLAAKLTRRNPHVFLPVGSSPGQWSAETAADVRRQWEAVKAKERRDPQPFLQS